MSKTTLKKKKKITFLLAAFFTVVLLTAAVFSVIASGESAGTQGWNFNNKEKYSTNPIYMENHITQMPQTFEAYVNLEEAGTSPIISSFPGKKNRDSIHFGIDYRGCPSLHIRQIVWIPEEWGYATLQTVATFTDEASNIIGKGWTHIAITYEPGDDASGTFTLYLNGVNTETVTAAPAEDEVARVKNSSLGAVPALDLEYMQSGTREFSFGAEGSTGGGGYFRGQINSAAMYSTVLSAVDIASSYEDGVDADRADLIAYYDYDMSGNDGTDFIKDQSGNGHDFAVSFYERTSEPKDYAYSFAFVGDTQFTVKPEAIDPTKNYASSIYDWLVQNKSSKKIKYVLGLGDITESHKNPDLWPGEWELAVKLHKKLEDADIPYAIVEGNHDGYNKTPGTINDYFGNNKYFTDTITGYYKDGLIDSYYVNFDVGLHKYMIVALEHGADDNVLAWANDVVSANPDRRVIVITHALLGRDGDWTEDGKIGSNKSLNDGIDTWNKFIKLHENIIIAAAGHIDVDHIKCKTEIGDNGNEVKTFLINPQTLDEANAYETGMIAMFYFSDDGSDVQVEYISAYKTLEAQKSNSNAKDVLFGKKSQLSFKTQKTIPLSSNTEYGYIAPEELAGKAFALFSDKELVATYESLSALCAALNGADADNYQILLLSDSNNAADAALPSLNADVTLDLGTHDLVLNGALDILGGNVTLTVKNGTVVANNTVLGTAEGASGSADVTFEDITFNFKSLVSDVTLFDLDNVNVAFDVKVLGGKIESDVSALSAVTFYTADASDSVLFGEYKNSYTKLVTHTTAFDYAHYTGAFPAADGNRYFVEIFDNGTEAVYELQTLTVVGEDVTVTIDITNNAKYLSAIDYPFVAADSDGNLLGVRSIIYGNKSDDSAIGLAKVKVNAVYKAASPATAYVLMRADYTMADTETYETTYIKGTVVLDMRGYSITSPNTRSTHLFEAKLRHADYTSNVTVKNGAIKHGGTDATKYVVCFTHTNNNRNVTFTKNYNIEFDSVTFSLIDGALTKKLFHVGNYGSSSSGTPTGNGTVNFTLTDCTFDLRSELTNSFTVLDTNFGQSKAYIDSTVKINGGKILANNLNKLTFTNFSCDAGDKVTFGAGSDGDFISLHLPKNADASKFLMNNVKVKTESGMNIGFVLDAEDDDACTYKMYFVTKYGNAPAKYADATQYPFVLFGNDGSFIGAADSFNAKSSATSAISYAVNYMKNNAWNSTNKTYGSDPRSAIILMMGNYTVASGENVKNIHQLQGTLTVDINGKKLTAYGYQSVFNAEMNTWDNSGDASLFPTEVIVKNGTISSKAFPIVEFTATKTGKDFTFKFEGVSFTVTGDMTARSSAFIQCTASKSANVSSSVEFTDCIFDLSKSTPSNDASVTLFSVGNANYNISVTLNGGSVFAGNKAFVMCNETAGNGSLTFNSYEGKYTSVSVANGSSVPDGMFNGGALEFVKTDVNANETVYTLAAASLSSFTPKMSLTLDRDLVLNVYVPAAAFLTDFTLDGVEYTDLAGFERVTLGEENYYLVSIALDAKSAARDVILLANVTLGDKTARATFTFGVVKYAEKILADESDVEKTLVRDVLSYVRAAYAYFNTEDVEKISKINAILGENYDDNNAPVIEGSANATTSGLKSATFSLDGTPNMRFYLADGADASKYAFFIGGKQINTETSADGKYIDIDVYAYALCETVTYTVEGVESGSFHINTYYEWSKTQNNENLVNLVARFWKYLQSARAYRDYVVEG